MHQSVKLKVREPKEKKPKITNVLLLLGIVWELDFSQVSLTELLEFIMLKLINKETENYCSLLSV